MINGRLKKKRWHKTKNMNSFHLNTKPQILKTFLFYGQARVQSTWERGALLGALCHNWYNVIRMAAIIRLPYKIPPCIQRENSVQASLYQSAWKQVAGSAWSGELIIPGTGFASRVLSWHPTKSQSCQLHSWENCSKAFCSSDLFGARGQRMVPCPWPERYNHHFLSCTLSPPRCSSSRPRIPILYQCKLAVAPVGWHQKLSF